MAILRKEFAKRSSNRDGLARAPIQQRAPAVVVAHRASRGAREVPYRSCRDRLIRAARRLDAALGVGDDRRIEVGDAFLEMSPIHVVLVDLRVQLTQQVALAIFAGVRLLKCGGDPAILAVLREVRQSHLELHADEVREVAPVGVIHFDRIVRLVGLPRQGDSVAEASICLSRLPITG
jgi:hypothetical protein